MDVSDGTADISATDRWGWVVPIVCAVHCLAAPVLLVVAPAFATSTLLEGGLMAAASLVAVPTVAGGVQAHGRSIVWLPIAAGAVIWASELMELARGVPDTVLTVTGSLLLAGGLLWNARLRARAHDDCACTVHRAIR
jgi:hypothetical protein